MIIQLILFVKLQEANMKSEERSTIRNILLIAFICLNLLNINASRFDGEPPTETGEVTESPDENQPSEESVPPDPNTVEEVTIDDVVGSGEIPVDKIVATEEPPAVDVFDTDKLPTVDIASTEEPQLDDIVPVEEITSEAEPVVELLEGVPENTDIIVLDENGEVVPLVTQEAEGIILEEDPMWCPVGVLPGGAGCSTNYSNISSLLSNMRSNTSAYQEDGTIYFTANSGGSFSLTTASSSLGNSDYNTLKVYNLTLQGGWNGANGTSATFTGQTNFGSNTLTIGTSNNRWVGNITLNNFIFNGVSNNNAITIYTSSGDITLDNVDVSQQRGGDYTAYLDSDSGDITVQNDSSFDGNNSGNNQNRGFRAETNSGAITIADTSFTDARGCGSIFGFCLIDALVNYNGATLSAPIVTLTNVIANNNDLNGIEISNADTVTLNNVTVINNGTSILFAGLGSGVNVNGTGSTVVNVNGGMLSNNESYGLSVFNGSISVHSNPTCNGNRYPGPDPSGCYNILPLDTTPPTLNLPANITVVATSPSGAVVSYSATATDDKDGSLPVNCTPTSGYTFPINATTVTCTATDNAGNSANGNFMVIVMSNTAIEREQRTSAGEIPVTGSSLFDISCIDPAISILNPPGAKITFVNLCGYQAILDDMLGDGLPNPLPEGTSFVNGVTITVLQDGEQIDPLPSGSSFLLGLPTPSSSGNEFAVLFWNGSKWTELSGQSTEDGFFDLTSTQTGTFILVTK
jgi:hypothetical protein